MACPQKFPDAFFRENQRMIPAQVALIRIVNMLFKGFDEGIPRGNLPADVFFKKIMGQKSSHAWGNLKTVLDRRIEAKDFLDVTELVLDVFNLGQQRYGLMYIIFKNLFEHFKAFLLTSQKPCVQFL